MWYYTSTGIGLAAMVSSEAVTKMIQLSLTGLFNVYSYMKQDTYSMKKYKYDIDIMDIPFKLQLINNWLKEHNVDNIKNDSNLKILYNGIYENSIIISQSINTIQSIIKEHELKWFNTWRTIYIDDEIEILKKNIKILDERLQLVNIIY